MVVYVAKVWIPISRDKLRNLMRYRGLRAMYWKLDTTIVGDLAKLFTCLVDYKLVTVVDQVWATDITYISPR